MLKIQVPWDVTPCRLDIPTGQRHWRGLTGISRQYESGEEGETRANHPVMLDTREMSRYAKCREMCENRDRAILHSSFMFHYMLQHSSSYSNAALVCDYRKIISLMKLSAWNKLPGILRHSWEENIKIDFRERRWKSVDWIHLVQQWDQWQGSVNTVINFCG